MNHEQKKLFETEYAANEFAKEVGGTVKMQCLPNYMSVDIVYVVTYKEEPTNERKRNNIG